MCVYAHAHKIIILFLFKLSTQALTDGFSQDFKRLHVSSSLQDYSKYSGWS